MALIPLSEIVGDDRHPCTNGHYQQGAGAHTRTRATQRNKPLGVLSDAVPPPSPTGNRPDACARPTGNEQGDDGPEMLRLEEAHRRGLLDPVRVELGALPPGAGRVMRDIAEHMRLRMGLRLAVGEGRALPYAVSQAVDAGIARCPSSASKAIGALVRAGVICHVGSLPPLRRGCLGTKLYAPPATLVPGVETAWIGVLPVGPGVAATNGRTHVDGSRYDAAPDWMPSGNGAS